MKDETLDGAFPRRPGSIEAADGPMDAFGGFPRPGTGQTEGRGGGGRQGGGLEEFTAVHWKSIGRNLLNFSK